MTPRYWIQNADLSSTPDQAVTTALAVLQDFDNYDWGLQWALQDELERNGAIFGAPGFGIVRKTGHTLHLCPHSDGTVYGFWHTRLHKKILGFIPSRENHIQRVNDLRHSIARLSILKFIEGDDAWLYNNFHD